MSVAGRIADTDNKPQAAGAQIASQRCGRAYVIERNEAGN